MSNPVSQGSADAPAAAAGLVQWIKDESGLTWSQLARTFDVSRHAVHLWASGGRVSATSAGAIGAFAALVREAASGSPAAARSALLAIGSDGLSPVDRFRRVQYARSGDITGRPSAVALLGDPGDRDDAPEHD